MKLIRYILAFLLLAAVPALAQTAAPVVPGFRTTNGCPSVATTPCFKATSAPIAGAAVASNSVLSAAPAALVSASVVAGASAGFMLIFDAVAAPADGAVTPKYCYPVAANAAVSTPPWLVPPSFSTGIVVVFSTTGCFTKTASATAFIVGTVE